MGWWTRFVWRRMSHDDRVEVVEALLRNRAFMLDKSGREMRGEPSGDVEDVEDPSLNDAGAGRPLPRPFDRRRDRPSRPASGRRPSRSALTPTSRTSQAN